MYRFPKHNVKLKGKAKILYFYRMKSYVIIAFYFLTHIISSCSQSFYQFPIYSADYAQLSKLDELVTESDDYDLGFSFYGHDTPFQIRIYNKSNKKLYINWKESFISINNRTYKMYSAMSKSWLCKSDFNNEFSVAPDTLSIADYEKLVIKHGEKSFGDSVNAINPNETLIFNSIEIQKDTISLGNFKDYEKYDDFRLYQFNKEVSPISINLRLPIKTVEDTNIYEDSFWISGLYNIEQKQFDTPYLHKKSMNMATIYSYNEKKILKSVAYYFTSFVAGYTAIVMSRGASVDPSEIGD
jgi:hypothetical protein